ncbi:MAG: DUF4923 family protein [Bacteroidales bacterium]|nr:DUF4923 family protein [Bacteroidales bacterium]
MVNTHWIRACVLAYCLAGSVAGVQAQDLKGILSGVVKAVGEKVSEKVPFAVEGTWKYTGQDCQFTSDNLLAKAGGEVAAKKVEAKMQEVLEKLGFTEGCTFVFNADSTYTSTVKNRTVEGTYRLDTATKELKMTTQAGRTFTAAVSYNVAEPKKMSLLFNADKLMDLAKTVSNTASLKSSNATLKSVSALLNNYQGLKLGFELEKQP